MTWVAVGSFVAACAASLLLTPLSIFISHRLRLLDEPGVRKVHQAATPRLGGIGIVGAAFLIGVPAFFYVFGADAGAEPQLGKRYLAILLGAACVFVVGLLDDLSPVSSRFKLLALLAASCVVCGSGGALTEFRSLDLTLIEFPGISWAITALWITGVAVAFNFIDGLDGLAGGLALLACLVLAFFLVSQEQYAAAVAPFALAGGILGFLYFNWHPARTFMGDGGSLTIGFLIGALTVVSNPALGTMRSIVLPGLALSVSLLDAALTLFRRRYQQRRSLFSAERGHIHHRLLDRGFSHKQAVFVIHTLSVSCVLVGLAAITFDGWATLGGLALIVPILWGLFHAAGSVRTGEMVSALRRKRDLDRHSRRRRNTFEALQLEFDAAKNFSEWWQVVCNAAERLEFSSLELPVRPAKEDGAPRVLRWRHAEEEESRRGEQIEARIPVTMHGDEQETRIATVHIPLADGLEAAGQRLALFSRLVAESGEQTLRRIHVADTKLHSGAHRVAAGEFGGLRVALVHDFFYTYCGAERVVEQIINVFPHCDVFGIFDFMPDEERGFLRGKPVTTTFIQHLPFARTKHRSYLPLMPLAIEQLDLAQYDLVISSSYLVAKGVITGPDQLHVCYCHSPVRYGWDLQHQYLHDAGLGFGPKGMIARAILHYLRNWDARSSLGVDHFIANSRFVARRIDKVYRRDAEVIYPPVDTSTFVPDFNTPRDESNEYYLAVSRLVSYKRVDMIIEAFNRTPHRRLVVIGDGPERPRLEALAGENVELLGFKDEATVVQYMQRAKAFVFAAEEDFGIVPVEAMACGAPVIAFGKGGVTESVKPSSAGLFFDEQTPESLLAAIDRFEQLGPLDEVDRKAARQRAEVFAVDQFVERLTDSVRKQIAAKWTGPAHRLRPVGEGRGQVSDSASGQWADASRADSSDAGVPLAEGLGES